MTRVLLMDDESIVREIFIDILDFLNIECKTAEDGQQAIELFKKNHDSGSGFDAVFLDLTVPGGIGGREAIKEILNIRPDVKAVVTSGDSSDEVMKNCKDFGFDCALAKPFKIAEIKQVFTDLDLS